MTCHNWWNHEFCTLSENPEGECPAISLWPQAQVHLGYAAGQWSQTHQQVHLWMAQEKQIKVLEWPNQSPDLNPTEMLWHDLKQSIHAGKPSNVVELKQFCKEEWAKNSSTAMWKTHCQLSQTLDCSCCCKGWHKPVFRFRGQLLFHIVPGRFRQLFSLNK